VTYLDRFLARVPRANQKAYEDLARMSEHVLREHGALRVLEWARQS
jgi:uncharacterized protein YbaA (DUF1428 family)